MTGKTIQEQVATGCVYSILIVVSLIVMTFLGLLDGDFPSGSDDATKIVVAKNYVRNRMLNYPDTADFHDMKTSVTGNEVTLTVTAKNAFGVPSTHTFVVTVDDSGQVTGCRVK